MKWKLMHMIHRLKSEKNTSATGYLQESTKGWQHLQKGADSIGKRLELARTRQTTWLFESATFHRAIYCTMDDAGSRLRRLIFSMHIHRKGKSIKVGAWKNTKSLESRCSSEYFWPSHDPRPIYIHLLPIYCTSVHFFAKSNRLSAGPYQIRSH